MWFTRVSIQHPVFATMVMLAFVVVGLFSYQRLAVEQFPDINFPVVLVQTEFGGASPEVIEAEITRKLEEAVNTISGIKEISSRSYEGLSLLIIRFDLNIDPVQAAQEVREKIALVKPAFRTGVKEPLITRFDPDENPVVSLALKSDKLPARELTTLADQLIKRRLQNVRGVGRVTVVGGVRREIAIELDPIRMEALRVSVDQVMNTLRLENQDLPAGPIQSGDRDRVVQITGRIQTPQDFERLIVARRQGQPVFLSQIARVVDGEQEVDSMALVNGERAIALDVVKAQGENTIAVVDAVVRSAQDLKQQLPQGVDIVVVRDASRAIRNSVASVQRNIVEGAALTVLIVFLFLSSWRSTVITGLTLPISLIGTFSVMYLLGFSINLVTLLALAICVGLLIDDAIVVRENIVRHQAMGKAHRLAAFEGTQEIGLAVAATTFSIVAVFFPIGFMEGIIGRFFKQFGLTVAFAVLLSMLVSFTLDPMLSSAMAWLESLYVDLLRWGLKHRAKTMLIALVAFFSAFPMLRFVGTEFVPVADNNEIYIRFYTPEGSSLALTQQKSNLLESALRQLPGVTDSYTTINSGLAQGKNYATIVLRLVPRAQRPMSVDQMRAPVRAIMGRVPGVTVTDVGGGDAVGAGKPIQVSLQGPDSRELNRIVGEVLPSIQSIPGIVDVDTSSKPGKPSIDVALQRIEAADQGVGLAQIASNLRTLLAGDVATTWRGPDDENYDVRVRLAQGARNSLNDLGRIPITTGLLEADGSPRTVSLRNIASLRESSAPTQINRKDLVREVAITAGADGVPPGTVGLAVQEALKQVALPPGYRFVTGGSTKDMVESAGYAAQALMLAVIFIYMILASQFGSFLQPVAIMMSLPLSLIGVVLALLYFGSTLNMFSMIGFIMLMGLVTKNAILLIDFANQARAQGMERGQALLRAAEIRLRPILMTTLAMIFGMAPLAPWGRR
ncbi:MAG: efflux RND transporter permease subunit [Betaproteobacteria bacterium]|nr:efflux RND transporter permease subunit [Betaproteobacteria bacterium]